MPIAYESPEGRIRVERESPVDFALYLDGIFTRLYSTLDDATHAGGVWLDEQAAQLAVDLADEAAALAEPITLADIARQGREQLAPVSADPWDDGPEPYSDSFMSPEKAAEIDSWLKGPPPAPQQFTSPSDLPMADEAAARDAALSSQAAELRRELAENRTLFNATLVHGERYRGERRDLDARRRDLRQQLVSLAEDWDAYCAQAAAQVTSEPGPFFCSACAVPGGHLITLSYRGEIYTRLVRRHAPAIELLIDLPLPVQQLLIQLAPYFDKGDDRDPPPAGVAILGRPQVPSDGGAAIVIGRAA